MAQIPYKIYLDESELPEAWYNLRGRHEKQARPPAEPRYP